MPLPNFTGIRCPGKRKHTVKGVEYDTCGSLIFGDNIDEKCDVMIQCRVCKRWWHIEGDGDGGVAVTEEKDGKNITFMSQGGDDA